MSEKKEITALKRGLRFDMYGANILGHLTFGILGGRFSIHEMRKRKIAPKKEANLHFTATEIYGVSDRGKSFKSPIENAEMGATYQDQVNVYIPNEKGKKKCYSFNYIFGSQEFERAFRSAKEGHFDPSLYDFKIGEKAEVDCKFTPM